MFMVKPKTKTSAKPKKTALTASQALRTIKAQLKHVELKTIVKEGLNANCANLPTLQKTKERITLFDQLATHSFDNATRLMAYSTSISCLTQAIEVLGKDTQTSAHTTQKKLQAMTECMFGIEDLNNMVKEIHKVILMATAVMEKHFEAKKSSDESFNLGILRNDFKNFKKDMQNRLKKGETPEQIYQDVASDIFDNGEDSEDDNMEVEQGDNKDGSSEGGSSGKSARANPVEGLAASLRATEI
jgi:hypothetical protein